MNHGWPSDAIVSASITGPPRGVDVEGVEQHLDDAAAALGRRRPAQPGQPLDRDPGRHRRRRGERRRDGIDERHHAARAHVAEAVGRQAGDEVGRGIVGRRRPDVRLPPDRREQHEHLGQAPVEGVRLGRPADPLEPVPERLGLDRVVEQDRVAEVAQVAARDGVDPRLVEEQPTHRRRVDHRAHDSGGNRPATAGVR